MRVKLTLTGKEALHGLSSSFLGTIVRESCERALPNVFTSTRTVLLDVACVSDTEIQKLNFEYRGKNKPTDILSFGVFRTPRELSKARGTIDLGQLVLSPAFIARSAKEDSVSWKREFVYVFSHGVLHLLGYDHSPKMFRIQDAVTDEFTA